MTRQSANRSLLVSCLGNSNASDSRFDTQPHASAKLTFLMSISRYVLLVFVFALSGCASFVRHVYRETSQATVSMYQIPGALTRSRDESSKPGKAGIVGPIDLDTYPIMKCAGMATSGGKPSRSADDCTEDIAYDAAIDDPSGDTRNRLKEILISRSDLICSQTIAQIVGTNDLINFSLGSATTVLAGVGALVTGATTAKLLSGAAAMTNATRSQVNEIFYENALKAAIIQKMTDLRTVKLALIDSQSTKDGKATDLIRYSTEHMLADVVAYHNSCSFYAGVNGLTQDKSASIQSEGDAAPSPPSIQSMSSKDGKISIAIDAPTDGKPIAGYTAIAKASQGLDKPLTGKSVGVIPFIEISDCVGESTYSVTILAMNKNVDSAASAARTIKCNAISPKAGPTVKRELPAKKK